MVVVEGGGGAVAAGDCLDVMADIPTGTFRGGVLRLAAAAPVRNIAGHIHRLHTEVHDLRAILDAREARDG